MEVRRESAKGIHICRRKLILIAELQHWHLGSVIPEAKAEM